MSRKRRETWGLAQPYSNTTRDAPPVAVARVGCRELSLMFIGHSEIGTLVLHRCNADKGPLLAIALRRPFSGDPPNLLSRPASRRTRETATGWGIQLVVRPDENYVGLGRPQLYAGITVHIGWLGDASKLLPATRRAISGTTVPCATVPLACPTLQTELRSRAISIQTFPAYL